MLGELLATDPDCPFPDPLNYTVHLPHEWDCTKFYKCDHGFKVLFECPPTTYFSETLEVCVHPEQSGCTNGFPEGEEPEPSAPQPSEPQQPQPSEPEEPEAPQQPPNGVDPDCPYPDPLNYTVHLPYESNCSKFYKCDNGKKVEFDCPPGLYFSPSLEVCVWPSESGCSNDGGGTGGEEPQPSEPSDPEEPQEPANGGNSECPFPDPLNYTVHLPHESDCSKFYKCDNGKKVEFDCPPGLYFSPSLEACVSPSESGCSDGEGGSGGEEPQPAEPEDPQPSEPEEPQDYECPFPDPLN